MIYNPIFEEEQERKTEFKELKKAIQVRARKHNIKKTINRVYSLLTRKPIENILDEVNTTEMVAQEV